jgi:hypothetical protein
MILLKNYKIKIHKVDKDFLSLQELQAIEETQFSIERLQIVKDTFVLCYYTELAYIDLLNLSDKLSYRELITNYGLNAPAKDKYSCQYINSSKSRTDNGEVS